MEVCLIRAHRRQSIPIDRCTCTLPVAMELSGYGYDVRWMEKDFRNLVLCFHRPDNRKRQYKIKTV